MSVDKTTVDLTSPSPADQALLARLHSQAREVVRRVQAATLTLTYSRVNGEYLFVDCEGDYLVFTPDEKIGDARVPHPGDIRLLPAIHRGTLENCSAVFDEALG